MLCFRQLATLPVTKRNGPLIASIYSNVQRQLKQRGAGTSQCAYQTQSYPNPETGTKRGRTPLSLALVGATALSVGLDVQKEGVPQACAALDPAVVHRRPQKWQLFDEIGTGAYGVVRLGMHEDSGEVAAVKIVPLQYLDSTCSNLSLEREVAALRLVKALGGHDNIIDLRDVYVEGRNLFLVTELARGGELFEQIVAYGSFPEAKAQVVSHEIASALSFLHGHGLVHKDVKPENILLSARVVNDVFSQFSRHESLVKLADFGSAGPADMTTTVEDIGTAAYLPPELLTSGVCTSACDMWALGCVLYITLCGAHPFDLDGVSSDDVVEHRITTEAITFDFSPWDIVSLEAKDLISKLLEKDPALRLTADQMLQHPWMKARTAATVPECLRRPSPLLAGQPILLSPA